MARVMGPHGIRGLVKIKFFGEDPSLLDECGPLFDEKGRAFQLHLKNPQKDMWLAEIEGILDRTAVENLGKFNLYMDKETIRTHVMGSTSDNMNNPEDQNVEEYLYSDLIGLEVRMQKNNSVLGRISGVENHGASDLIEVKNANGIGFLIPFTNDVVPVVNIKEGYVLVDPLKGMIEE